MDSASKHSAHQPLDPGKVATARIAAGLATTALAARLGIADALIKRIETGENQRILPLGLASDLAEQLDVGLHELLAGPADTGTGPPTPDDVTLEEALAERNAFTAAAELAELLGWTYDRVLAAAATLERRLSGTGVVLRNSGWQQFRLSPGRHGLSAKQRERIAQHTPRKHGLTRWHARLLMAAVRGQLDETWTRQVNNRERITVGALARQGLIYKPAGRNTKIELTDEAKLGLAIGPLKHLAAHSLAAARPRGKLPTPPVPANAMGLGSNAWAPSGTRGASITDTDQRDNVP